MGKLEVQVRYEDVVYHELGQAGGTGHIPVAFHIFEQAGGKDHVR